jgi:hypothetical protein
MPADATKRAGMCGEGGGGGRAMEAVSGRVLAGKFLGNSPDKINANAKTIRRINV